MSKIIVTLTGPSCSGKSTLERKLRESYGFASIISTTTRAPRAGEVDGQSYYFTSKSEFKRLAEQGAFIERVSFNDNLYAVSAKECERAFSEGKPVVVVVEPEGFKQISEYAKKHCWTHVGVFVDIEQRLQLERFIARAKGDESLTAQALLSRLAVMNGVEQNWRKEAQWITSPYDIFISRFDEESEQRSIDRILYGMRARQAA